MAKTQVALVTGGGAGMGLATATKLIENGWKVIIVDLNNETGLKAAEGLGKTATFFQADVTKWDDQVRAFEHAVELHGQINFVFANAGIAGRAGFYDAATTWPPEKPSLLVEEVCLKGVVYTTYLAMHYMRRNKPSGCVIVTTASGKLSSRTLLYYLAPVLIQGYTQPPPSTQPRTYPSTPPPSTASWASCEP
jgi:15-hydroxyprostaglandin dehydrogenase (NAD)